MDEADILIAKMPAKVLNAFEVWKKTHKNNETARIVGVHPVTVSNWRKKYQWDKIEKLELERMKDGSGAKIEQIKEEQRKIIEEAIEKALEQLRGGKLKARSFSDLVALLKYRLELEGEFRNDVNITISFSIAELHEELEKRRKMLNGG